MQKIYFIQGLKIFVFGALAIFAFGFITMHLWNWLMPDIFGLQEICWMQAMGLVILSKILFGGFKGAKKCCGSNPVKEKMKKHFGWKDKMKERYENMSDEEKAKFKDKCSSWVNPDDDCC